MLKDAFFLAVGYAACILFPMPGVSRWVLDKWAALGAALAKIK